MHEAIVRNQAPNLLALHYDPARWTVRNLILVPRFVFSLSSLQKQNPLRPTARRHDYVLCNQQLQILRDLGFLESLGGGRYRIP